MRAKFTALLLTFFMVVALSGNVYQAFVPSSVASLPQPPDGQEYSAQIVSSNNQVDYGSWERYSVTDQSTFSVGNVTNYGQQMNTILNGCPYLGSSSCQTWWLQSIIVMKPGSQVGESGGIYPVYFQTQGWIWPNGQGDVSFDTKYFKTLYNIDQPGWSTVIQSEICNPNCYEVNVTASIVNSQGTTVEQQSFVANFGPINFFTQEEGVIVGPAGPAYVQFTPFGAQNMFSRYIDMVSGYNMMSGNVYSTQTGESSDLAQTQNLGYTFSPGGNCGGTCYGYTIQNDQSTPGASSFYLTVNSENQNGQSITGYYTVLELNGNQVGTGFTPVTFDGMLYYQEYEVSVDNYGSCIFSHWSDNGNTNRVRTFEADGFDTFTAVYDCSSSTGSVTVNTVNQNNQAITGYYVGLYNSGGTLINHDFSPATFSGLTIGTNYSVEPDNYGSCAFNHWQDTGSTIRDRAFTAASTQTFTAVYECT